MDIKIRPRILIATDKNDDAGFLKALLTAQGYDIETSYNAYSALEKIFEDQFDLVIIESELPEKNGLAMAKQLRGDKKTHLVPIILVMRSGDVERQRFEGIEAGCDDFITKPFDENDILTRVYTLLKISQYRPLLNERERFEHILNNVDAGIVVFDNEMRVTHLNRKARDYLPLEKNDTTIDFINKSKSLFRTHYSGDLTKDMQSSSLTFDMERPQTKTVKQLILNVRINVVKNPLGEPVNIIMMLTDVTENRREEILKQNFLDLISHKLRTPIAVIKGAASAMADGITGELSGQQKESVEMIIDKSSELHVLVDKLLRFTTISAQCLTTGDSPLDAKKTVASYVDSFLSSQKKEVIEINIDIPDEDIMIPVDKIHLELILGNIIENSVKFNDKEKILITIAGRKTHDSFTLSVTDNGPGIPAEEKDNIFKRFYQVEKYFTGNVGGAGLGLALTKRLVAAYNGDIVLNSSIDKGTKFIVTLPLCRNG